MVNAPKYTSQVLEKQETELKVLKNQQETHERK